MTVLPAICGLGVGLGLVAVIAAWRPRPVPLAVALSALDAPATRTSGRTAGRIPAWLTSMGPTARSADLAILDRGADDHAAAKLRAAWLCAGFVVAAGSVLAAGGLPVPWPTVGVAAIGAGAAGFVVPDVTLRSDAARRRRAFAHATGALMELTTVVLAAGGGLETALFDAAAMGDGWAFDRIRRSLDAGRHARRPPWVALGALGRELAVVELEEVAASVTLAGETGARIRSSLRARTASLRQRHLSALEAEAQSATERMALPTALMLFGFLAFVLFPALQLVVGL